jgi:hypothetical protein
MSINYFHHQMHIEAKRLAEQVCAYCDLDPHSRLAEEVRGLEAGELVSIFYLMAHERLPLEDALTQFVRVIAIRMPPGPSGSDTAANASSTCGSFSNYHPRERIHLNGSAWGIVDNR